MNINIDTNEVVSKVFASSLSRPLFILGGTLMKFIFHKRMDICLLGHFLQSSGISVTLPERLVEIALYETDRRAAMGYGDGICIPSDEEELFHSVGKFHYEIDTNECNYHMWDKYIFYPTCKEIDYHFDDCKCPDDEKQYNRLVKSYSREIGKKFEGLHLDIFIRLDPESSIFIRISHGYVDVRLNISDKFWVDKGKPFMIFGDTSIDPVQYAALLKKEAK